MIESHSYEPSSVLCKEAEMRPGRLTILAEKAVTYDNVFFLAYPLVSAWNEYHFASPHSSVQQYYQPHNTSL